MKSCCEYHGFAHGCEQGKLCPERSYPGAWWLTIYALTVIAVFVVAFV